MKTCLKQAGFSFLLPLVTHVSGGNTPEMSKYTKMKKKQEMDCLLLRFDLRKIGFIITFEWL